MFAVNQHLYHKVTLLSRVQLVLNSEFTFFSTGCLTNKKNLVA